LAAPVADIRRRLQLAAALGLAEELDRHDSHTAEHSRAVARLSTMVGLELGFDERRLERLSLAAVLHDIGKISIPSRVLHRPGPLTAREWKVMRRHPELGARMLSDGGLEDVQSWILAHHERPDGTGYPRGLRGDEIPIEASILAVADAYDAMTSVRAYRPILDHDEALQELRDRAGTQFSAEIVEVFVQAVDEIEVAAVAVGSKT
jgi:putative nucleotidyltransferase with HDIG domain